MPDELLSDEEQKLAIAAAFGADAMVFQDDEFDENSSDSCPIENPVTDAEESGYSDEVLFETGCEGETPLVRYTKELANAIYGSQPMPGAGNRCGKAPKARNRFVPFLVGKKCLGLPITVVREIARCPKITPLPQTPSWLQGVANFRGEILPVIDLHRFFGFDGIPAAAGQKTILVHDKQHDGTVAIAADRVLSVRNIEGCNTDSSGLSQPLASVFEGYVSIDDLQALLIDPVKLFELTEFNLAG